MTKNDLLQASINEFRDRKENALFWTCDKVYTDSGFLYIIKKNSKPISCALHFAHGFESNSILGKYETADILINTVEDLGFEGIITYKDLTVAFTSSGNYNEEMKEWHYYGVGAFSPISQKFIVLDEKEIDDNLGVNSTEIILGLKKDYPIVPHFFEAKSEKQYILFETVEREDGGVGSAIGYDENGNMRFHKIDRVKLTFVNFNRNDAMGEIYRIQQESLKPETKFGIMSEMVIKNTDIYQIAFNWRAAAYSCEFSINYYIRQSFNENLKKIKKGLFSSLMEL